MLEINFNLDYIEDVKTKLKMKQIIDKIRIVLKSHTVESTDFLDPYEIRLGRSILNQISEISYTEYGGLEKAERKILYIFPEYMNYTDIESKIGYLNSDRFESLTHRDYLGSILSLGVIREKIGDILLYKDKTVFIVKKEIINYIIINLTQIGNHSTNIKELEGQVIDSPVEDYEEFKIFTSSLRLDSFLSSIYKISRSESLKKIKSNDVKINWEHITKATKILNVGDIISLRGFGRSKIFSYEGQSRKGKNISTIRKPK
ncbi:MAG: YlmH/Sll1252 family protein [Gudongella sp.]|nr:YlmH/Sll1252 family protein [Gudongella sp.]